MTARERASLRAVFFASPYCRHESAAAIAAKSRSELSARTGSSRRARPTWPPRCPPASRRGRSSCSPDSPLVEANDGARRGRPDLDEIAQLVDHPEAAARPRVRRREPSPCKRVVDAAGILDLADGYPALRPEPQHARAAAVPDAVDGGLVHREREIGRAGRLGPQGGRPDSDRVSEAGKIPPSRRDASRSLRGRRSEVGGRTPRWHRRRGTRRCGARTPPSHDVGVALTCCGYDCGRQSRLVVGTQECERLGARERQVQERLVTLAFCDLGRRALAPDRLADTVERFAAAGVACRERVPDRDDARGVAARTRMSMNSTSRERSPSSARSTSARAGTTRDEDGLVALDGGRHERQYGRHEPALAAIEHRVVPERPAPVRSETGMRWRWSAARSSVFREPRFLECRPPLHGGGT